MLSYSPCYSAPAVGRSAVGYMPFDLVGVAGFEPAASSSRTMYFRVGPVWLSSFGPIKSQVDGLLPVSVDAVRYRPLALSSRSNDGQTILGRRKAPWGTPASGSAGTVGRATRRTTGTPKIANARPEPSRTRRTPTGPGSEPRPRSPRAD